MFRHHLGLLPYKKSPSRIHSIHKHVFVTQTRKFPTHVQTMKQVNPMKKVNPGLVIFDKDGTLLDFNRMWSSWVEKLALGLEESASIPVREHLFDVMGYNSAQRSVISGGAMCCTPMHELRRLGEIVLEENQFSSEEAKTLVDAIWCMPDPIATAYPLADLPTLFSSIRELDIKIAVCTTDDHEPTIQSLEHFGVLDLVDCVIGGDDPLPPKPSPEQIWHICNQVGVAPEDTVMVGDTNTDMSMGRAAGVGLNVGILDGASSIHDLSVHADALIPELNKIYKILFQYGIRA